MTTTKFTQPQIYVACLAAYNEGSLHGKWIDVPNDKETLLESIKEIISSSPAEYSEEWAIHDYDLFGANISENPDLDTLCELASLFEEKSGMESVIAQLYNDNGIEHAKSMIEDNYMGCYESKNDFIYQWVEDTCMLEGVHENVKNYFDYDALLHDMECNSEIFSIKTKYNEYHYFFNR